MVGNRTARTKIGVCFIESFIDETGSTGNRIIFKADLFSIGCFTHGGTVWNEHQFFRWAGSCGHCVQESHAVYWPLYACTYDNVWHIPEMGIQSGSPKDTSDSGTDDPCDSGWHIPAIEGTTPSAFSSCRPSVILLS